MSAFSEEIADLCEPNSACYSEDIEVDPPLSPPLTPEEEQPPAEPTAAALQSELVVNLKEPIFSHGVIMTDKGGVITAPGLRIQAQRIEYTNKIENGIRVQKIVAEGDLMMDYADRAFVGQKLEYDFIHRTGTLWEGKTFVDMWFLGGDKIELKEDGTFYIYNAFVTTCESQDNTWEIKASSANVTKEHLLSAKNISFRYARIPLLWLPGFKSNLKFFSDPPIRYKVAWDKGLGPRATMRYRIFSWEHLNLFFRLDYRLKRGFGSAIESEYYSPDQRTVFVTRSYAAQFKTFPDEKGPNHFRLQGLFHTHSTDGKTQANLTYDKLSDQEIVSLFRSDDFEINTQKRTRLLVTHEMENVFGNFSVQPRINNFQSIDQELPLAKIGFRSFELGKSGIISDNRVSAGFLDYVYASALQKAFNAVDLPTSTHAVRLETQNSIYRPIPISYFTLTPKAGIAAIYYNNNPDHQAVGQFLFLYGADARTRLSHQFNSIKHTVEPYATFCGLTNPTQGLNDHFIFDINDGFFKLNQLRLGVKNYWFTSHVQPSFFADLYTYGFFDDATFSKTFPKGYLTMGWNQPSFMLCSGIAWNAQENLWDYTNIRGDFTINKDIAFGAEFRHRSRFDWRKASHENFILDVARPISELLESPLSDGRNTFLTRFFVRLTPRWNCQFQSRHGWGRKKEPGYNQFKIDVVTLVTCSWRLRLSYERVPDDNRFTGSISLVK